MNAQHSQMFVCTHVTRMLWRGGGGACFVRLSKVHQFQGGVVVVVLATVTLIYAEESPPSEGSECQALPPALSDRRRAVWGRGLVLADGRGRRHWRTQYFL